MSLDISSLPEIVHQLNSCFVHPRKQIRYMYVHFRELCKAAKDALRGSRYIFHRQQVPETKTSKTWQKTLEEPKLETTRAVFFFLPFLTMFVLYFT